MTQIQNHTQNFSDILIKIINYRYYYFKIKNLKFLPDTSCPLGTYIMQR